MRRRKIGRNRANTPTATQPTDNATQPTPTRKGSSFRGKGLNLGFDMPDMPMKRPAAIAWAVSQMIDNLCLDGGGSDSDGQSQLNLMDRLHSVLGILCPK